MNRHISKDKEIAGFIRGLLSQGWSLQRGGKHNKVVTPEGFKLAIPGTPSDWRAARNFRRDAQQLRRRKK
jgi:hypothetical protein